MEISVTTSGQTASIVQGIRSLDVPQSSGVSATATDAQQLTKTPPTSSNERTPESLSGVQKQGSARRKPPTALYSILIVATAVTVVLAVLAISANLDRGSASSATILVKKRTIDYIPQGQLDAVLINTKTSSVVNGSVTILFAVQFYTMNSTEYESFVKTLVVSGYLWTSGLLQNISPYLLNVQVPAGFSYLVFANPLPIQALVGFNSDLTLKAS